MFDEKEKAEILKYYELPFEKLEQEDFAKKRKKLRAKYHPDNFSKYEDETVKEMATERFQSLEKLSEKMEAAFNGNLPQRNANGEQAAYRHSSAVFAAKKLKIEIITDDKDLKYKLFGRKYRWLLLGDEFKIPGTDATIVTDEDYRGTSIGFNETIRIYLTFGEDQKITEIVDWFYPRIAEGAKNLLVEGTKIEVLREAILQEIQKRTFLRLN